jgi:lysophospholipase L1-like esterase
VYAAIGASETVGIGTEDPIREAWPRVLWRTALPQAAFFNLGVPGSTTAEALREQVPAALSIRPDVVTVWLNVNDLIARVPPATYERQLTSVVHRLRRGGATEVLVATTPRLDSLPAYLACRPSPLDGTQPCEITDPGTRAHLPPPTTVRAAVAAYNRAIARVCRREGASVVDLGVFGDAPATHPDYVSSDGFHPSAAGAAAIASVFALALDASSTADDAAG